MVVSSKRFGSSDTEHDVSIDSLLGAIWSPCLVKMDIDGGEVAGIEGASLLNPRRDLRRLIETHSLALENKCLDILPAAGFHTQNHPSRVVTGRAARNAAGRAQSLAGHVEVAAIRTCSR